MKKLTKKMEREIDEMYIKITIHKGKIKKSIELCEKYGISSKRYGELVREVSEITGI